MASRRALSNHKVPRLPQGFKTVQDILEGDVPVNKMASVIGLVKDYRAPMKTSGTGSLNELHFELSSPSLSVE